MALQTPLPLRLLWDGLGRDFFHNIPRMGEVDLSSLTVDYRSWLLVDFLCQPFTGVVSFWMVVFHSLPGILPNSCCFV